MPKRLSVGNFVWCSTEAFATVSLFSLHYRNQRSFVYISAYHSRFKPEDDVRCMVYDQIIDDITAIGVCQGDHGNAVAGEELNTGQETW